LSKPSKSTPVVLDTNILVAAAFNPGSHSAQLLRLIRRDEMHLVWNESTRRESHRIVEQIPPLAWGDVSDLFNSKTEFTDPTDPSSFTMISDPDDRKFAALAAKAGAVLVSNDDHLLSVRSQLPLRVLTPGELLSELDRTESNEGE
jgi:uncharacterized protein